MDHIKSLQDRHPFHDIFGDYYSDADEMFDEIEADVERDIDHAAKIIYVFIKQMHFCMLEFS